MKVSVDHKVNIFSTSFISREDQERLFNQKGKVIWLTGLSGSGKSTIARGVQRNLFDLGYMTKVLDGDNIRLGINKGLDFSIEDRVENIRRIAEVAKLFLEEGVIVLCAFISPTAEIRQKAKEIIGKSQFTEVYTKSSIEICEKRDVKGLYKKARKGEISNFTGINSVYEAPENPALILDTESQTEIVCINQLTNYIIS